MSTQRLHRSSLGNGTIECEKKRLSEPRVKLICYISWQSYVATSISDLEQLRLTASSRRLLLEANCSSKRTIVYQREQLLIEENTKTFSGPLFPPRILRRPTLYRTNWKVLKVASVDGAIFRIEKEKLHGQAPMQIKTTRRDLWPPTVSFSTIRFPVSRISFVGRRQKASSSSSGKWQN